MRDLIRSFAILGLGAGAVALVNVLAGAGPESFSWFVARAAGLMGYVLLTLSVLFGVTIALRPSLPGISKAETVQLHRGASILAFGFLAVHMGALLADQYVPFSVGNLIGADPASYRPWAVLAGSLAAWLMLIATTAFAWRRLLGPVRWRWLHRSAYGAWALALVHGITAGTDSGAVTVQWLYVVSVLLVAGLVTFRLAWQRSGQRPSSRRSAPGRGRSGL